MSKKDIEYAKLSDSFYGILIFAGLGAELAIINNPSLRLVNLVLGMPCIIIGAFLILQWNVYYEHRVHYLKYVKILLVAVFVMTTIIFGVTAPDIEKKLIFYVFNVILIVLLLMLFIIKEKSFKKYKN
jgi:hypothetical protein